MLASVLPEPYKSARIIAPSRLISAEDEAAYVGFYTLIISLIRMVGGELSGSNLKRYLRRFNAEVNTYNDTKSEDTLSRLQRQGYLVKTVDKDARQHGDEEQATAWLVGPRGKVEVTDEAIAGLVREVWDTKSHDDALELEKKLQASLNIRDRKPAHGGDQANDDESRVEEAEEDGGPSRRGSRRKQARDEEEDEDEVDDE